MLPTQTPQQEEKKDLGFIGGIIPSIASVGSYIWNTGAALPSIIEAGIKTGASIGQLKTGVGAPAIIRESIQDYETARKDGAGTIDSVSAGLERRLPLAASYLPSLAGTVGSAAELGSLGLYDYGESGNEFANALRQGRLGEKILEDIGNVMLFGRLSGAGSLATRAGKVATDAGATRLGTTLRRTGYLSEQPIAATIRGTARLAEKALRTQPVRSRTGLVGSRLAEAGRRISGSETPLLETFSVARRGMDIRTQGRIDEALRVENDLKQQKAEAERTGQKFSEEKETQLRQATKTIEDLQKRTTLGRRLRSFAQQAIVEGEAQRRGPVQMFTRFSSVGAIPEGLDSLQRQLDAEVGRVNRGETQRQPIVDHIARKIQAKQIDPNNEQLNTRQMKEDSMGAAAIVGTQLIDVIKSQVDQGVPIQEIIARITPEELPESVRAQGYSLTPSAIQKALDYVEGRLDGPDRLLDRVSVDEALLLLQSTSDFLGRQRQTGKGMVRGAGDPFEQGQYPIPRYVLSAIDQYSTIGWQISSILDSRIAQLILVKYPQLIDEMGIDLTKPDGLFEKFAETPSNPLLYQIAYEAIQLSMPDFYNTPQFRDFVNDPNIFPAPMRIKVRAQQGVIQAMRGQDVSNLAEQLTAFAGQYPDVLPPRILSNIETLVDIASDAQKRLDKDNWKKAQGLVNQVGKTIKAAQDKIASELGELNARMDERWVRLEEISAAVQSATGMIQTIIDQPSLFADQAQLAEVSRLRGTASEAQAGLQALGEPGEPISPFRVVSEIEADTQQLQQRKTETMAEVKEVERSITQAESRLAEAESLTPDDIADLEINRNVAREIEQGRPDQQVNKQEAKAEVKRRIQDLANRERQENIALRDATISFVRSDLTEDVQGAINRGLGANTGSKLYKAFVSRFTKPKPPLGFNVTQLADPSKNPYTDISWDVAGTDMANNFGLPEIDAMEGITEAARRFKALRQIQAELVDLRRVDKTPELLDEFRKQMEDEINNQIDQFREQEYREAELLSPEGFVRTSADYDRILNDAQAPDLLRNNVANLRTRLAGLADQLRQIDETIARNADEIAVRRVEQERTRLLGEERRATQQASQLESVTLKNQQAEIKSRLKGVGGYREFAWGMGIKVTPEGPKLQRQFLEPIQSETASLDAKQMADQQKVQELRESFARQDEALMAAQEVAETPLLADQERSRFMVGRGEGPIYMPVGGSRLVTPASSIDMALQAEGIAPEAVGSFERMRQGSVIPLTPGQVAARLDEVMNALTRNIVMQRIITEQGFVSTVAEVIPLEQRTALMDQATQIIDRSGRDLNSQQRKDLVQAEYQKLVFDELQKQGLDPISPVAMPDPMDIYAERAALGALDERVNYTQIDDTTMVMPRGMRQGLASQFVAIGTGPPELGAISEFVSNQTAGWKSMVLPGSVRWQVGDHTSSILNAWIRGDVPPAEMYALMPELLQRMQGENPSRRDIMFNQEALEFLPDPVMQAMETMGLQSSGRRLADLREMRKGTLVSPPTRLTGRKFTFPKLRQKSFAFNEFQNKWVRHTLAFKKLQDILNEQGRSIDEVTPVSILSDQALYDAVQDAVSTTNDALGNFSQMTEFERRYVRSAYPFWAWIKYINKAAAQLMAKHPDKVVFFAHLGGLTMEKEAEGLWEFLQGSTNLFGLGLFDLQFFNPYSDAILFQKNPFKALVDQATNLSPVITFPATGVGELYYGATGTRPKILPTFSRPGYLEGRPGETTRTFGDTLGGIAYQGLKTFGGPYRNLIEWSPVDFRVPFTDVAVGYAGVPRFPQGSLRTTGPYAERRLSPWAARTSALLRTFGTPAPMIESDIAERLAAESVRRGAQTYRRRLKERRLAQR